MASSSGEVGHPVQFVKGSEEITKVDKTVNKPHVEVLVFVHGHPLLVFVESVEGIGSIESSVKFKMINTTVVTKVV